MISLVPGLLTLRFASGRGLALLEQVAHAISPLRILPGRFIVVEHALNNHPFKELRALVFGISIARLNHRYWLRALLSLEGHNLLGLVDRVTKELMITENSFSGRMNENKVPGHGPNRPGPDVANLKRVDIEKRQTRRRVRKDIHRTQSRASPLNGACVEPGTAMRDSGLLKTWPTGITEGSKLRGSLACFSHFNLRISTPDDGFFSSDCANVLPQVKIQNRMMVDAFTHKRKCFVISIWLHSIFIKSAAKSIGPDKMQKPSSDPRGYVIGVRCVSAQS